MAQKRTLPTGYGPEATRRGCSSWAQTMARRPPPTEQHLGALASGDIDCRPARTLRAGVNRDILGACVPEDPAPIRGHKLLSWACKPP